MVCSLGAIKLGAPREEIMAVLRDQPYADSNFLVDLGNGDTAGPRAGFDRVVLPALTNDVVEYRLGNDKVNWSRKAPGRPHFGNAIFERGVLGSLDLFNWWREVALGNPDVRRTVIVQLLNEQHTNVVMTWKLLRAFPVRLEYGPLVAHGHSMLVERLELCCEEVELE